jgi:hypothetical protein
MDKEAVGAWAEVGLRWEGQVVEVLLREEMAQADLWVLALVETALLVARAVVDLQWEALAQAVDLLRWVGPEADLHLLEGQQSHN